MVVVSNNNESQHLLITHYGPYTELNALCDYYIYASQYSYKIGVFLFAFYRGGAEAQGVQRTCLRSHNGKWQSQDEPSSVSRVNALSYLNYNGNMNDYENLPHSLPSMETK